MRRVNSGIPRVDANTGQLFSARAVVAVLSMGLATTSRALNPTTAISQYQQDVWTERDGLPQGSVQAITQTNDGYLWVGTRDGLARFDGIKFVVFRAETTAELRSNDIRDLTEDQSGNLWIGTFNGGLCRYSHGHHQLLPNGGFPGSGALASSKIGTRILGQHPGGRLGSRPSGELRGPHRWLAGSHRLSLFRDRAVVWTVGAKGIYRPRRSSGR